MQAIHVEGSWMYDIVQPNLILRYIHREGLGVVDSYTEDRNYNVTFYIKKCNEDCFAKLKKEFPNYEISLIS